MDRFVSQRTKKDPIMCQTEQTGRLVHLEDHQHQTDRLAEMRDQFVSHRTKDDQQILETDRTVHLGPPVGYQDQPNRPAEMRDRFASQRTKEDPTCRHRGRTVPQAYLVERNRTKTLSLADYRELRNDFLTHRQS